MAAFEAHGMTVTTPLGADALFLASFRGNERVSGLFQFQLEVVAENQTKVPFDKLLGQPISFSIILPPDGKAKRTFNGICKGVVEEGHDATFTTYRLDVVP